MARRILCERGKTLHHQIGFLISHLVTIPFGTTQRSDMFDDFRVGAAGDLPHPQNSGTPLGFNRLLCFSGLFSAIFPSIGLSFFLLCFFILTSAFLLVGWALIKRCPEVFFIALPHLFQEPNLHLWAASRKMETAFVWNRLHESWNNYGNDIKETVRGYNTATGGQPASQRDVTLLCK